MLLSLSLPAPAKINLSLRTLSKRTDGYHEIETLMAPLQLADEVKLELTPEGPLGSITLSCNEATLPTNEENLCVKAALAFQKETGLQPAITISLLKKIPHGAGLGGGSSDAAAVLRGMNQLLEEPLSLEKLHQLAASIGSDVPFFLDAKPRWCRGRGELLGEIISLPAWKLLLIKPPFLIASAEAYERLQRSHKKNDLVDKIADDKSQIDVPLLDGISLFNDLEIPVFEKYSQLSILKKWLQEHPGVITAWMTGSGSTIVAALQKKIPKKNIATLKKNIAAEFGNSFWTEETSFREGTNGIIPFS